MQAHSNCVETIQVCTYPRPYFIYCYFRKQAPTHFHDICFLKIINDLKKSRYTLCKKLFLNFSALMILELVQNVFASLSRTIARPYLLLKPSYIFYSFLRLSSLSGAGLTFKSFLLFSQKASESEKKCFFMTYFYKPMKQQKMQR